MATEQNIQIPGYFQARSIENPEERLVSVRLMRCDYLKVRAQIPVGKSLIDLLVELYIPETDQKRIKLVEVTALSSSRIMDFYARLQEFPKWRVECLDWEQIYHKVCQIGDMEKSGLPWMILGAEELELIKQCENPLSLIFD